MQPCQNLYERDVSNKHKLVNYNFWKRQVKKYTL